MSTRDSLVQAAAELLDIGGPAEVTLRAVAAKVGVSHNAPYKHFADKQDLLAAVAARELRQAGERAGALLSSGDPAKALRDIAHGYVDWAHRRPARFKLTFGAWTTASDELGESATASRAAFVELVSRAQAAGLAPAGDPDRVTALILALAHGAADLALGGHLSRTGKGHADPGDLVDDLLGYLAKAAKA